MWLGLMRFKLTSPKHKIEREPKPKISGCMKNLLGVQRRRKT